MKLSELFNKPFRLKGGSILNLKGFSKRVIDRELNDQNDTPEEYKDDECLGFTAVDGDVTIWLSNFNGNTPVVYYKKEGQDWALWDYSNLTIAEGETIRFYGENNLQFSKSNLVKSTFKMSGSGKIEASGDCNSLATKYKIYTIKDSCFYDLFNNCTLLISAPKLSAIFIAPYCYRQMFYGTNILIAPELPATILAKDCYGSMFADCTKLTIVPKLPAINLVDKCYQQMFAGCTNLSYIKAMFITAPSNAYTSSWLNNVAATGTFVKNSQATWDVSGVNGIPEDWTIETADE